MTAAAFNSTTVDNGTVVVASWTRGEHAFRVQLRVREGGVAVYLGANSSVTSATGFQLDPGRELTLEVPPAEEGVAASLEEVYATTGQSSTSRVHSVVDPS